MKRQKLDENDVPSTSSASASASSSSAFGLLSVNATKAGMSGLDTEKINSIVAEASKGSKFYEAKSKNQVFEFGVEIQAYSVVTQFMPFILVVSAQC